MGNAEKELRAAAVVDDFVDTALDRFQDAVDASADHPADPRVQEVLAETVASLDVLLRVRKNLRSQAPRRRRRSD